MRKRKHAIIIDPYSHGSYHEVINQSYLMMIADLYERVTYFSDKSSCDNIRRLLNVCHVVYNNVEFVEKRYSAPKTKYAGVSYLLKLINTSWIDFMRYARAPKGTDVFYNNNIFFAILPIQWLCFWKHNPLYIMCHNDMEMIDKTFAKFTTTKIISLYLRLVFCYCKLSKRFHFILLSPRMRDYFCKFIASFNQERIHSIDHAYIRPTGEIKQAHLIFSGFKIGIPGAVSPSRGLNSLKKLLSYVSNEKVKIYAISTISEKTDSSCFVAVNKTGRLMPSEEYAGYVQAMDALLLLYDTNSYKLTASGSALEAIWQEKPIFALHNAYVDYLFDKFGNMGILFDSVEDIAKFLQNPIFQKEWVSNIRTAKTNLLPSSVLQQLKEV